MSEIVRVLMQQDGTNPVLIGILLVVAIAALVFLLILLKFARCGSRRISHVPTSSSAS
jgi:hypothetical protein